jgi:O-antigen/teichoic acid export membrane protein
VKAMRDKTYFLSVPFGYAVNFLIVFILLRYISPEDLGIYNLSQLFISYCGLAHFGLLSGFARELPATIASTNSNEANLLAGSVRRRINIISIFLAVGVGISAFYFIKFDSKILATVCATSIVAYYSLKIQFLDTLYRGHQKFHRFGLLLFIQNILNLATLPLAIVWGFVGLLVKLVLYTFISHYIRTKDWRDIVPSSSDELSGIFRVGVPIFIGSVLFTVIFSIDRAIIAHFFGVERLGQYAVAAQISGFFMAIASATGLYFSPKAIAFISQGSRGQEKCISYGLYSVATALIVSLPAIIFGLFFLEKFILAYAPNYIDSIEAGYAALITGLMFPLLASTFVFAVLNKSYEYLKILIFCGLFYLLILVGLMEFELVSEIKYVVYLKGFFVLFLGIFALIHANLLAKK